MEKNGRLPMSGEDIRKIRVLDLVLNKKLTQSEAAKKLGKSDRQIRRYLMAMKTNGDQGIIHGLVGKKSNRRLSDDKTNLVIELWNNKYKAANLNFTHFTEKLVEVEGIQISREKVRKLLRSKDLVSRKEKKSKKHRSHRIRREHFGELLQQDTSPHDWLGDGVQRQVVVIVDDATSALLHVQMFESDGTLQNMTCMKEVFLKYGLPMAIYTDKASWFHYSGQGDRVIQTHVANREKKDVRTQIGKALDQLGVELIPAHSPQAKGRVERANGTLQDRLISEFKLAGIKTVKEANEFIKFIFIPDYNKRFALPEKLNDSVFVKLVNPSILENILCLEFFSKVQNDNTISKSSHYHIQLLPTPSRAHWVKAKARVRIHLDGSVSVSHADTDESIPHKVLKLKIPKEFKYGAPGLDEQDISTLQNHKKTGQV